MNIYSLRPMPRPGQKPTTIVIKLTEAEAAELVTELGATQGDDSEGILGTIMRKTDRVLAKVAKKRSADD